MATKEIINWNPKQDPLTKKGEIALHEKIHKIKFERGDFTSRPDRISFVERAESLVGDTIKGNVLDIGCGNGYASVYFAKNRDCKMYSMECDVSAVDLLVRENYKRNGIDQSKYELVLGSFNQIPLKNHFEWVISLGAIHHSGNLIATMESIYSCLSPGGYFIAHEPYMDSFTPNSLYVKKEGNIKNVQGIVEIKESERDDHFFRHCEYLTSFHHSGFDVIKFEEVKDEGDIKNGLIILRKPKSDYNKIPHKWN